MKYEGKFSISVVIFAGSDGHGSIPSILSPNGINRVVSGNTSSDVEVREPEIGDSFLFEVDLTTISGEIISIQKRDRFCKVYALGPEGEVDYDKQTGVSISISYWDLEIDGKVEGECEYYALQNHSAVSRVMIPLDEFVENSSKEMIPYRKYLLQDLLKDYEEHPTDFEKGSLWISFQKKEVLRQIIN